MSLANYKWERDIMSQQAEARRSKMKSPHPVIIIELPNTHIVHNLTAAVLIAINLGLSGRYEASNA